MKRFINQLVLIGLLFAMPVQAMAPWGFFAHRRINELAVYTLPPEMFGFYKKHIEFIKEHAVDPDKRRYGVVGEAERHFIDIDHYCKGIPRCNPFNLMPRDWADAKAEYSEDTLRAYGIVPWHIPVMKQRLTNAFREKNVLSILRISTELGHYIGDASVPLHTTENYNGQMTNQKGIHGFWESRLPELYEEDYDFFVGKAEYISDPLRTAWEIVQGSHWALDSVLTFERELNDEFPPDEKYSYEERGRVFTQVYSEEYSNEYHRRLNGQVERRMRASVIMIGSMWFSAWIDAGQPDLDTFDTPDEEEMQEVIAKDLNSEPKKELMKRIHDN